MTFYSTTLLPPSPPYHEYNQIIEAHCDMCMKYQEDTGIPEAIKEQMFEYTMALLEFWYHELTSQGIDCDS